MRKHLRLPQITTVALIATFLAALPWIDALAKSVEP